MELSIYLATRNGSTRNPPSTFAGLLERLRELADELVVLVDDTTTDDTFEVAQRYTKCVYSFVHDPLFIEIRRQSFYRCTRDWIFAVDDDDKLSSRWTRQTLEQLMKSRSVTHYWVPSRFLVADDDYLSTAPYIGHFSAMIYRNIDSIAVLPMKLHQQMAFAGEPAYLAGLYIDAMDLAWHSRPAREAKLRTYEEAYDEWGTGFDQGRFYLYEDYYFETKKIDDAFDPMIMAQVVDSIPDSVDLRFLDCPARMTVGQTYWIAIRIVNGSHRALLPQSEFLRWGTLNVSYHWLDGSAEQTDDVGMLTPFPARILPNHQHDALIKVRAPEIPGTYALQLDVLEDNLVWFSKIATPERCATRSVVVTPLVWPPQGPA